MSKSDNEKKNAFEMDDDFGLEFQKTIEKNKKKKEVKHDTSDMLKIGKLEEVLQQDADQKKPKVKREQILELEVKDSGRMLKRATYTIELRHIDFITKYAEKTNRSKNAFLRYMIDKMMEAVGEDD
ncbi:hypothetical protein SAMN02745945_02958 [Peptoclostridium litorale DSM 5388]|uniref:Uncharacterized protein n=1 Tax=Peptoclostridium litorale DSM 5388 TaxID=1121324 RepID=A0A069RJ34_PEPLI|nr:hypothetical protein [Peptoclostridium litorale]KDR96818.1 hypothetical protein CLIT_20p00310 [Peptoclostridium litorale DSM 5388]SIO36521.1 hypothetical protein SAMN02745945_02958 [Peptoclostridium litorale DSM 5388]